MWVWPIAATEEPAQTGDGLWGKIDFFLPPDCNDSADHGEGWEGEEPDFAAGWAGEVGPGVGYLGGVINEEAQHGHAWPAVLSALAESHIPTYRLLSVS